MDTLLRMRILRGKARREKIIRHQLLDTLETVDITDSYLAEHCGVNRQLFVHLLRVLEPVVPKNQRSTGIPFPLKVLTTLSFLSQGSHQKTVGKDFSINISQKSVSRAIKVVVEGLNILLNNYIVFPSQHTQRTKIKEEFYRKFHMPEVIGSIAGMHVEIVCPRDDEDAFYNRKGQYTINAQLICDSDTRVIAVCCRFGGAANDAYIWNNMSIKQFVEDTCRRGETGWLLGDSRHQQRPWLMTPVLHAPQGTPESQYNLIHSRTHSVIYRCMASMKTRWKCLHKRALHYNPQRAAKIINACAVLHNMCLNFKIPEPPLMDNLDFNAFPDLSEIPEDDGGNDMYIGLEVRRQLAERLFYNVS